MPVPARPDPTDTPAPPSEGRPARRPYAPPVLVSGPAFERVLLQSSCGNDASIFEGCTDPC